MEVQYPFYNSFKNQMKCLLTSKQNRNKNIKEKLK